MPNPKAKHTALYVRLPVAEAAKLDRAAFELKAAKQDLVTGLVARYVDPGSVEGLDLLRELAGLVAAAKEEKNPHGFGFGDRRRVVVETEGDSLTVGRHAFRSADQPEVLSVKQAALLLQVEEDTITGLADAGELPGRRIGGEWRFARRALLDWLAHGEES
jgi:excisionase family DNA binding protein